MSEAGDPTHPQLNWTEDDLGRYVQWSWDLRSGSRIGLIWDRYTGVMQFILWQFGGQVRGRRQIPLKKKYSSFAEARDYMWQLVGRELRRRPKRVA